MDKKYPIIGIPGWRIGDNSFGISIPYLEFFNQYGIVKVLTLANSIDESIDLLVIPGGVDVDPRRYGAVPSFETSKSDPIKEYFETVVLPQYIKHGTPVFGICRGIQTIAVLYGATLIQDIRNHKTNESLDRVASVHHLKLLNNEFVTQFIKTLKDKNITLKVNSLHHQCVSGMNFPDTEFDVVAVYNEKNGPYSIEAIAHKTLPIMAVQYHPEEMGWEKLSDFMIETLISKSKNYA